MSAFRSTLISTRCSSVVSDKYLQMPLRVRRSPRSRSGRRATSLHPSDNADDPGCRRACGSHVTKREKIDVFTTICTKPYGPNCLATAPAFTAGRPSTLHVCREACTRHRDVGRRPFFQRFSPAAMGENPLSEVLCIYHSEHASTSFTICCCSLLSRMKSHAAASGFAYRTSTKRCRCLIFSQTEEV
ncbi:unnamed protein product [Amoebophrya sp. A120]|nr:unnamed protein product [Amoebophrya sp. A120]|eukprot:GSA120T00015966001.1